MIYISRCEYLLDDWEIAIHSGQRSLSLAKEHEHKIGISLGNLYYSKTLINKDRDSAISICQESLKKLESLNSYHVIDAALTLCLMFILSKELSDAKDLFSYVRNNSTLVYQKHKTLEIELIISLYLQQKGRPSEAKKNLKEVIELSKKSGYQLLSRISNYYLQNLQCTSLVAYPL